MSETNRKANKLVNSTSPYLLQHAYNPVDWYPWGEEALGRAIKEDKPVLVSIGYSACHWCHVMEKESFEDPETARIMNTRFVCIKVDREERPDVDNIYMEAVQTMGMPGGWPLNVFLTPDLKPFYGGTYFPKSGWQKLLESVSNAFENDRSKIQGSADSISQTLTIDEVQKYKLNSEGSGEPGEAVFDMKLIKKTADTLYDSLDPQNGGMRKAPKFPMPSIWLFLLRYYYITKEKKYLQAVDLTLDKMANGGIYDHLEGGFARYSVDEKWFLPHFEKMLYDNGQLLALYSETFSLTGKNKYREVIDNTINWMQRNLLSPGGGFYSALDADSEGVEGKYYVWHIDELRELLGQYSEVFISFFEVSDQGNWEQGNNILHIKKDLSDFLKNHGLSEEKWKEVLDLCKDILLKERDKRIRPGLDNKILAGWNGITISGLVKAYHATGNEKYKSLAVGCGHFISDKMINKDFSINRVYGTEISGVLEDYAFVINGFIELYQADFNYRWLHMAKNMAQWALDHFYDYDRHMFYFADSSDHSLIARKKEIFDNVIPSSNSQMASNLFRLGLLFDNHDWIEISRKITSMVSPFLEGQSQYMSNWAITYLYFLHPTAEIAITGKELIKFRKELSRHYYPFKLVAGSSGPSEDLPLLINRGPKDGNTTLYVCFDKACKLPVKNVNEALKQLPGFESAGV